MARQVVAIWKVKAVGKRLEECIRTAAGVKAAMGDTIRSGVYVTNCIEISLTYAYNELTKYFFGLVSTPCPNGLLLPFGA